MVGFEGRAAEIARIHQYGEVDTFGVHYPVRELLGMMDDGHEGSADTVVRFLQIK